MFFCSVFFQSFFCKEFCVFARSFVFLCKEFLRFFFCCRRFGVLLQGVCLFFFNGFVFVFVKGFCVCFFFRKGFFFCVEGFFFFFKSFFFKLWCVSISNGVFSFQRVFFTFQQVVSLYIFVVVFSKKRNTISKREIFQR